MTESALACFDAIEGLLHERQPAVFLDYDGTLTPIVARPELAVLDDSMRAALEVLAQRCPVAIVSGRDLDNVRSLVGLDGLSYSGSHGFAIETADGRRHEHPAGVSALPVLDAVEKELIAALASIEGHLVERKRFSLAVHYRNVAGDDEARLQDEVETIAASYPQLRKGAGKKVLELLPDVQWNKGEAVGWLLHALEIDGGSELPVFIGDDVTDEYAFTAVSDQGVGILVADSPRETAAKYHLVDVDEVRGFLVRLAQALG